MTIRTLAEKLDSAAVAALPVAQLSTQHTFTLDEAYEIQRQVIQHRVERGYPIVGLKMGFTSEAKMRQMGVHDMIWGLLTSDMLVEKNGLLPRSQFIHPRAEPEVCFRICKDIDREIPFEELHDYVDGIAAAIEVIDSRYMNFKFSLEDVVADNCSSAAFIFGEFKKVDISLVNLPISLHINGTVVADGSSADILGDPWRSLQAATRLASRSGIRLEKGYYIMAGAATAAEFIKAGDEVKAEILNLGEVEFRVV